MFLLPHERTSPPTFDNLLSARDFINDTITDHCNLELTNNGENIPPGRPESLEFWGRIERQAFVEVDDEEVEDDEADVNGNASWTGDRQIAEILRKKVSEADGYRWRFHQQRSLKDSKAYTYYCSQSSIFKAESKSTGIRSRLPMERFQCEGEVYIFISKSESVKYIGFRYRHAHFHKTPIARNISSELRKFIAENTRMSAREITNLFRQRRGDFPNDKHITQAQIYFWWYECMQSSYLRDHNDEVQSAVEVDDFGYETEGTMTDSGSELDEQEVLMDLLKSLTEMLERNRNDRTYVEKVINYDNFMTRLSRMVNAMKEAENELTRKSLYRNLRQIF